MAAKADPLKTAFATSGPRMETFLNRIKDALGSGAVLEKGDDYGYSLFVPPPAAIDVGYELADSRDYDGNDGLQGCNPMLDIVAEGGQILGSIAPYNYTPKVWVKLDGTPEAQAEIEARMDGIENAFDEIICLVLNRKALLEEET